MTLFVSFFHGNPQTRKNGFGNIIVDVTRSGDLVTEELITVLPGEIARKTGHREVLVLFFCKLEEKPTSQQN